MIGASYMQSVGGAVIISDYAVNVTPDDLDVDAPNGGYASPVIRATPVNGVGPFDFVWVSSNPLAIMTRTNQSGATSSTQITASGFTPDLITGTLTCLCTDTGNGNTLTQTIINFSIQFVQVKHENLR